MGDLCSAKNGHFGGFAAIVESDLPSLASVSLRAVVAEEKTALILELLREAAQKGRNKKFQPFYSIRAVATRFAVPPTTVSRIYARLKDEGLLASVWGSKTFIEPDHIDRQLHFRAVIALPASLKLFSTVRNYRAFFLNICNELWRHGFATQLLFYEGRYPKDTHFVERLLTYKADIAVWYLADANLNGAAASLTDRGIRLVTVGDCLDSSGRYRYYVSRQQAIREGLAAWRREGIASVTVARLVNGSSNRDCGARLAMIETYLREVGLPYTFANIEPAARPDGLRTLSRSKTPAVVFPSSDLPVQLGSRDPAGFGKLTNHARVMLADGPVDFPGLDRIDGLVDLVDINWELPTRQICRDLVSPARSRRVEPVAFHAQWCPRRPISAKLQKL